MSFRALLNAQFSISQNSLCNICCRYIFNFLKVFTRLVTIFVAIETKAKSMKTKLNRRPMGQNGHVRNYGTKIS